ncbi:hypothetical protein F5888DRAFT_1892902 [Russula emetica]|nr:hypothetical protein F5888DRAFT_1892902 [Russula emetica]
MVTPNVKPWITNDDIEAQLKDDFFTQRMDPNGKSYGDPSTELWLMYLDEDESLGRKITGGREWDRDDILVFTSLFSTTVAFFLMESYKLLPPDLNNAIIASLSQITQQLVSISNVTPFQNVIAQNNAPFKPPASAIRINVTWLLSLVLSLTHALSATYPLSGFAQYHGARHNYPRTLHGIERSRPPRVVDSLPTLLHLSIFLFIAGLIDFLLLANKIVAFCVLGYVSAFSFACLVFTALSSFYLDNPRRTSLPEIAWRLSLIIVLAVLVFVVEIGGLLCVFISSIWNRVPLCAPEYPSALATWRNALEGQIRKKQRSPAHGLWQSIDQNVTAVQSSVDASPVCQTLSALDQDQKIKDFVAPIPGVFGSGAVPCMTSPILSSMEVPTSDPILGSCFHDLHNTCIPDTSALTEESRRNGWRASLKSLWYCGRAYHRIGNSAPLPHYVRDVFASPEMTRRIQNEPDPTARVIGRCFASLIAKKLSSDAKARSGANFRFSDAELASLSAILGSGGGSTSDEMMDWLDQPGVIIGLANIISLLSGEIDILLDGKVPPDVEQIMQETVVILGSEALHAKRNTGAELPLALVAQFRRVVSKVANAPAPEWLRVQLKEISEGLPTIPSERGR